MNGGWGMEPIYDDEILGFFIEESQELVKDLKGLGESLRKVGIPNDEEAGRLSEFAQKLNRLIGGTASMGFEQFTPLSRKTSLLAARCAGIREITIRILIANMIAVIAIFDQCFSDIDSVKTMGNRINDIDQRIDVCMAAANIDQPDIKSQQDIDALLEGML